jgi:hypothetical protein
MIREHFGSRGGNAHNRCADGLLPSCAPSYENSKIDPMAAVRSE